MVVYAGEEAFFEGFELWSNRNIRQKTNVVAYIAVAVGVRDHRRVDGVGGGVRIGELGPVGGWGSAIAHFDGDGLAELLDAEFVGAGEDVFDEAVFFVPFEEGGEAVG